MRLGYLLLLLAPPEALAWTVRPSHIARRSVAVRRGPRCCAVPTDLETLCDEACAAVRGGLLNGKRGMRVDVGLPSLNPTGRMYEPSYLARMCLELTKALTMLDGRILVLLPGLTTSGEAMKQLEDESFDWSDELRERVQISTLGLQGKPDEADLPGAVVVAGLSHAVDSDDPSFRTGRAWLALAGTRCASLCVNIECEYEPAELSGFEQSYVFVSYGITRTAANELGEKQGGAESSGVALLRRSSPGPWRLLFDASGAGGEAATYELLAETEDRLSDDEMKELIGEAIERAKGQMAGTGAPQPLSDADQLEAMFNLGTPGAAPPPAPPAQSQAVPPATRAPLASASPSDAAAAAGLDALLPGSTRALEWAALQDTGPQGAMRVYQAEALLRVVALGSAANFDLDRDALHCLGGVAPDANGYEVGSACLLLREGDVARLEQLCVGAGGAEERAQRARELLARVEEEAKRLGLTELTLSSDATEALDADVALCFREAGFVSDGGLAKSL